MALGLVVRAAEQAVAAKGTLSAQRSRAKAVPDTTHTIADQHIQQAKSVLTSAGQADDSIVMVRVTQLLHRQCGGRHLPASRAAPVGLLVPASASGPGRGQPPARRRSSSKLSGAARTALHCTRQQRRLQERQPTTASASFPEKLAGPPRRAGALGCLGLHGHQGVGLVQSSSAPGRARFLYQSIGP